MPHKLTIRKMRPTAEQVAIVRQFASAESRPDSAEYERFQRQMNKVNPPKMKAKERKAIPNTTQGFNPGDIRLTPAFNATDLPKGYAVTSCYDSGGNHQVEAAGTALLRFIWNGWAGRGAGQKWANQVLDEIERNTRLQDTDWDEYERRVTDLENQGLTRSDAQGVVDLEMRH